MTREELEQWLSERGLALASPLPETVGAFRLESSKKEGKLDGVDSYFAGKYVDPNGEVASVRLLGVPAESGQKFAQLAGRHLAETGSNPKGSVGKTGGLFEHGGAGILVRVRGNMLVVVSASTPEAAEAFANDLLPPLPSRVK